LFQGRALEFNSVPIDRYQISEKPIIGYETLIFDGKEGRGKIEALFIAKVYEC